MTIAEADLAAGQRIVYPNQGVCRVVGVTEMEIAGRREVFIKLAREGDNATVMIPRARIDKVGIRRVASPEELAAVFEFLKKPVDGPELDWKVRQKNHGEQMTLGGLMGLASVVKGLTTLSDLRPLPPKERELYDNARHLLVSEIAASTGLPEVSAEDAIDVALFPPGVVRVRPVLSEARSALDAGEADEQVELDTAPLLRGLSRLGIDTAELDKEMAFEDEQAAETPEEGDETEETDEDEADEAEKPAKSKRAATPGKDTKKGASAKKAPATGAKQKPKAAPKSASKATSKTAPKTKPTKAAKKAPAEKPAKSAPKAAQKKKEPKP